MKPDSFKDFVLEQLAELPALGCRRMFGGHGLYLDGTFFGILFHGRLFFKTDAATRANYLRHGMTAFSPGEKVTLGSYYEVPAPILEARAELCVWAQQAATLAIPRPPKRPPRRAASGPPRRRGGRPR